jgi:hypothetical protein
MWASFTVTEYIQLCVVKNADINQVGDTHKTDVLQYDNDNIVLFHLVARYML